MTLKEIIEDRKKEVKEKEAYVKTWKDFIIPYMVEGMFLFLVMSFFLMSWKHKRLMGDKRDLENVIADHLRDMRLQMEQVESDVSDDVLKDIESKEELTIQWLKSEEGKKWMTESINNAIRKAHEKPRELSEEAKLEIELHKNRWEEKRDRIEKEEGKTTILY